MAPVADEPNQTPGAPGEAAPQPVILVVDDDLAILNLLKAALGDSGYTVLTAANERAALAAAEATAQLDLLIADVNVPGAGGRRLATKIGAVHPQAHVIYISGIGNTQLADEGVVISAPTFLRKPFALDELRAAVADVLLSPA